MNAAWSARHASARGAPEVAGAVRAVWRCASVSPRDIDGAAGVRLKTYRNQARNVLKQVVDWVNANRAQFAVSMSGGRWRIVSTRNAQRRYVRALDWWRAEGTELCGGHRRASRGQKNEARLIGSLVP